MSPLWTLAPVSVALGVFMMWVFRRTANFVALREIIRQIQARLLEFWLFVDEPRQIGRTWKGLLAANIRLYRVLLPPLAILSAVTAPVFFGLDAVYGSSPLPVGKTALVTLRMDSPLENIPRLQAPEGIAVETPGVRVFSQREVSWRIRPDRAVAGELRWMVNGKEVSKSISGGERFRYHSPKRMRSLVQLVRYPVESPLAAGPVEWIEIDYPPATVRMAGVDAHWSLWFLAFSLFGAIIAPRRAATAT